MPEPKWDTWPPAGHARRLEDYDRYRLLFKGRHQDVYARVQAWLEKEVDKTIIYLVWAGKKGGQPSLMKS